MRYSLFSLCLILATANGFGPAKPRSRQCEAFTPETTTRWPLFAAGSEGSDDSSSTIRRMSWFLATQLLEKALKEVSKGEAESKMSMDDLEKLASVLQRTEEQTSQENQEAAQQEGVEETMSTEALEEEEEEEEEGDVSNEEVPETESSDSQDDQLETDIEEEPAEPAADNESVNVAESDVVEDTASEQSESTPLTEENESENEPTVESVPSVDDVAQSPVESPETEDAPSKTDDLPSSDAKEESPLSGVARIPDVISTAFGRSLEVVSSAVPPLRQSPVPKANSDQEETTTLEEASDELANSDDEIETSTIVETPVEGTPAGNTHLAPTSGFLRKVESIWSPSEKLTERARKQPKSKEEEVALASRYGKMTVEDRAFAILKDLGMLQNNDISDNLPASIEPVAASLETKSGDTSLPADNTSRIESGNTTPPEERSASNNSNEDDLDEEGSDNLASEASNETDTLSKRQGFFRPILRMIDKSREKFLAEEPQDGSSLDDSLSDAILFSRTQPKSPQEEAKLAEKYGSMSLEDRAYAILCDLGMTN